jgi:hypothetical protein
MGLFSTFGRFGSSRNQQKLRPVTGKHAFTARELCCSFSELSIRLRSMLFIISRSDGLPGVPIQP